ATRQPHSFPTRRSSDLVAHGWRQISARDLGHREPPSMAALASVVSPQQAEEVAQVLHEQLGNLKSREVAAAVVLDPVTDVWVPRSEEHTSELQSPDHLV